MNVGNRQFFFDKHAEDASFQERQLGIQGAPTVTKDLADSRSGRNINVWHTPSTTELGSAQRCCVDRAAHCFGHLVTLQTGDRRGGGAAF